MKIYVSGSAIAVGKEEQQITAPPVGLKRIFILLKEQFEKASPLMRLNVLAVFVGIVGGLGSWLFRIAIAIIYHILIEIPRQILQDFGYEQFTSLPFLLAPIIGGLIVGLIVTRVSRDVKGHGIPEVLESVALFHGKMNLRIPISKIAASATSIGSGGSVGREGPIAQISAGFASFIGQTLKLKPRELRTLVICGVSAGISAIFNAPIGGTLFALEIVARQSSISLLVPLVVASVVGTATGQVLLGAYPAFESFPPLAYTNPALIPLFIILGIVAGITSALWIKIFYKSEDYIDHFFKKFKIQGYLQPAIGGLFIGLILLVSFMILGDQWETYTIMGLTYAPMNAVFQGVLTTGPFNFVIIVLLILIGLKVLSTIVTLNSGGSGGVFSPSLFIGVMLGGIFGVLFNYLLGTNSIDIALFALCGMAGFFGGTGRAPLTAIIMTAEMTNDYLLTVPLMFVVIISWFISSRIEPHDIYILKLVRKGTRIGEPSLDILEKVRASKVMTPVKDLTKVPVSMSLRQFNKLVKKTGHTGFPVYDGDKFVGVMTSSDVNNSVKSSIKITSVGQVLQTRQKDIICTDANSSLAEVINLMVKNDVSRIPIVKTCDAQDLELIGWITNHNIISAYQAARINYKTAINGYK